MFGEGVDEQAGTRPRSDSSMSWQDDDLMLIQDETQAREKDEQENNANDDDQQVLQHPESSHNLPIILPGFRHAEGAAGGDRAATPNIAKMTALAANSPFLPQGRLPSSMFVEGVEEMQEEDIGEGDQQTPVPGVSLALALALALSLSLSLSLSFSLSLALSVYILCICTHRHTRIHIHTHTHRFKACPQFVGAL